MIHGVNSPIFGFLSPISHFSQVSLIELFSYRFAVKRVTFEHNFSNSINFNFLFSEENDRYSNITDIK